MCSGEQAAHKHRSVGWFTMAGQPRSHLLQSFPEFGFDTASQLHIVPALTPPCLLPAACRLQLLVLPPGDEPLHALQLPRVPRQVWAPASGELLGVVGRADSNEAFQRRGRCGRLGHITCFTSLLQGNELVTA